MTGLACDLAEERRLEDQVRAEHSQVPVRRMVIEQRHLGHHRVEGHGARVVRHDKCARFGRDVLQARGLNPEPRPIERTNQGHEDVLGEIGVESELIDRVVTTATPLNELPRLLYERAKAIR